MSEGTTAGKACPVESGKASPVELGNTPPVEPGKAALSKMEKFRALAETHMKDWGPFYSLCKMIVSFGVAIVAGVWLSAWLFFTPRLRAVKEESVSASITAAKAAVQSPEFLNELSKKVRPYCIFNTRGTIESEFGTSDYLDGFSVVPIPDIHGFQIVVKAKRHLAYAPLVSGLDVALYQAEQERTNLHDWRIVMAPQTTTSALLTDGGGGYTNVVFRFKLEILH